MQKYFLMIFLFLFSPWSRADELCPGVKIKHLDRLDLTDTEKQLLCGDKNSEAYKFIPPYEAAFILTGMLQSRGYLKPHFKVTETSLDADIGKKFKLKKFRVISNEDKLRKKIKSELKRLFRGRLLSTSTLNSVEAEALSLIRQNGHPCSKVRSEVSVDESLVTVYLEDLHHFDFGRVKKEKIEGLRSNALERYYPFRANESFNEDLLMLTEKRMVRSEVVQGTYFLESCSDGNSSFNLSQNFLVGPPRTIRFGVGASTEQGPMGRIRWSNNRYKSMASTLSAHLQASLRSQSINLAADSFFWHGEPRRSVFTQTEIVRESQLDYEQLVYRLRPHIKWTRDSTVYHKLYTLGPSYEGGSYHSKENADTKSFGSALVEGSLQWKSHPYELFDIHPQEGNSFGVNFDFRHPTLGFSDPLLKLDTTWVRLDRLANWGRGTVVGGVRLNVGTTWVSDDVSVTGLPPTVKFFGGGSDDLRGFQLRTLPQNDGLGALTKVGVKYELRRTYLVKESIEGFTFLDASYFGDQSWKLNPQLFYSPGIGLRWLSPIGLVQGFVARAFRTDPYQDMGNIFFIGIGGTF